MTTNRLSRLADRSGPLPLARTANSANTRGAPRRTLPAAMRKRLGLNCHDRLSTCGAYGSRRN